MCLRAITFIVAGACVLWTSAARAEIYAFKIDPSQSNLTLTTTVAGGAFPTSEQASESLVTSYSGTMYVELTGTTIRLLSPTTLVAAVNGNWLPGDDYDAAGYTTTAAPANYGSTTNLSGFPINGPAASNSAVRDLQIGLVDPAAKTLTGGTFDESGTTTVFTSGTVYYDYGAYPPITDLVNTVNPNPTMNVAGFGTLVESGNQKTLTLPVSFTAQYAISILPVSIQFAGTIVASVPEPASVTLVSTVCMSLLAVTDRRRNRRSQTR